MDAVIHGVGIFSKNAADSIPISSSKTSKI